MSWDRIVRARELCEGGRRTPDAGVFMTRWVHLLFNRAETRPPKATTPANIMSRSFTVICGRPRTLHND
jgi:hypothetical protein